DLELQREGEAKLTTKKFKPAIEPHYRWRDWAAKPDGITGDELLAFISQMNLLLHGLDAPQIDPLNSLRFKLTDIGERDRVDVILTNPPFGGEEEKGIQGNFPEDKQTA